MTPNAEQKTRAAQQFIGWVRKFHPAMHAAIVQRAGEAPKNGALNQLGEAWDMFYPSMYYASSGYRGRYHSGGEHLSGLGQDWWETSTTVKTSTTDDNGAWYSEILAFAKDAVPAYLAYDAQKDIMDMNIERAKQGLPPVDPGLTAPQVKVVHDFPPEVRTQITDWKNTAMKFGLWALLGLGAFFVVRRMT